MQFTSRTTRYKNNPTPAARRTSATTTPPNNGANIYRVDADAENREIDVDSFPVCKSMSKEEEESIDAVEEPTTTTTTTTTTNTSNNLNSSKDTLTSTTPPEDKNNNNNNDDDDNEATMDRRSSHTWFENSVGCVFGDEDAAPPTVANKKGGPGGKGGKGSDDFSTERTMDETDRFGEALSDRQPSKGKYSSNWHVVSLDEEDQQQQPDRPPTNGNNEDDLLVEQEYKINTVEEGDEEPLLSEDAYSLLYTSYPCSRTAIFAWFSICLQGGMLLVTFLDLFDTSEDGNETNGKKNRMEIPVGSTIQVTVAQFLGMLITIMVMAAEGDFVTGVSRLTRGYDPNIQQQSPYATKFRWLLSGIMQTVVGLLLLFDSFTLSMQSSTVIDLSLNLTALFFIQEVDNMAFSLASESGLFGRKVEADCEHVRSLTVYVTKEQKRLNRYKQRFLVILLTICLLVPYFIIIFQQQEGDYVCKNLFIQFGDEYIPKMVHFSGTFRSQGNGIRDRKGERNFYVEDTNTYKVAFCDAENFWSISELEADPCDFLFRSAQTETFDIIEAADENWVVDTEGTGVVDVDWLKIVCNDCNEETCPSESGVCSEDLDQCLCHDRRFGVNCQFKESCFYFALDQRTRDGLATVPGTSSFVEREYTSLYWQDTPEATPKFYGMPIYVPYNGTTDSEADEVDSFIVFTGRRWVLYSIPDERLANVFEANGKTSNWTSKDFNEYFDDLASYPTNMGALGKLTADLINYFPVFFSSPLNYGEASFGFDPSSVSWIHATTPYDKFDPIIPAYPDERSPVQARFLCTACMEDGDCLNGGYCTGPGGYCVCQAQYTGYSCERVMDCVGAGGCSGEGTCDVETRTCDCAPGSAGNLCQLGAGALPEPWFCNRCRLYSHGHGKCNSTFSQECICDEGFEGKYCNETVAGFEHLVEETGPTRLDGDYLNSSAARGTFAPTLAPTTLAPSISASPTMSARPSMAPSISAEPSVSFSPSLSTAPSLAPTTSASPSVSFEPSQSVAPSRSPTTSAAPSMQPTTSASPTANISHSIFNFEEDSWLEPFLDVDAGNEIPEPNDSQNSTGP